MEIVKDHSSINLPHSPLCPGHHIPFSTAHSREIPRTITPAPGDALQPLIQACHPSQLRWHLLAVVPPLLLGCMALQPWLIPPTGISHAPVTLLGSLFSLTQSLGRSPPAPHRCAVGHGGEQCLLHSHLLLYQCPCPFLLTQPFLLVTCSPNSPSSRLSRHSWSQQFVQCCRGRLCGNDCYKQEYWLLEGALACSSFCKKLCEA